MSPEFSVYHEDDEILVVHKPPGIHVHPTGLSRDEETLQDLVEACYRRRPSPAHRLDRPTSGLVIFCWDPRTAGVLGQQFQSREVEKTYQALVRGWCPSLSTSKPLEDLNRPGVYQQARTTIIPQAFYQVPEPLGRYDSARFSLVELRPHTGRRHQLRRHLKALSHPLVGDTQYPDGRYNAWFRSRWGVQRLMLLAQSLRFPHPASGRMLEFRTQWEPEVLQLWTLLSPYLVAGHPQNRHHGQSQDPDGLEHQKLKPPVLRSLGLDLQDRPG